MDTLESSLTSWLTQTAFGLGILVERHVYAKSSSPIVSHTANHKTTQLRFGRRSSSRSDANKYFTLAWEIAAPLPSYLSEDILTTFDFHVDILPQILLVLRDSAPDVPICNSICLCKYKLTKNCSAFENRVDVCFLSDDNFWICNSCRTSLAKPKLSRHGFIYVIGNSVYGFYKIGKSKQVQERSRSISIQLPFELELIHAISADDYHEAELKLHQKLAGFRTRGEWFALSTSDLSAIKTIKWFEQGVFVDVDNQPTTLEGLI